MTTKNEKLRILKLKLVDEYTNSEIANFLNVPVMAVAKTMLEYRLGDSLYKEYNRPLSMHSLITSAASEDKKSDYYTNASITSAASGDKKSTYYTNASIIDSVLYESIYDAFYQVHPHDNIIQELKLASNKGKRIKGLETRNLHEAFGWRESPQGVGYWKAVSLAKANLENPVVEIEPTKAPVAVAEQIDYVITPSNLTFVHGGQSHSIDKSHTEYKTIMDLVLSGYGTKAAELVDVSKSITSYMKGAVSINNGVIKYQGMEITGGMTGRILDAMKSGEEKDVDMLVNFFNNLMENPSYRAVNELFGFLEAKDIELTDDGYFYAFKKVNRNLKDIYTGKFDNSPGTYVQMPRHMVNEDPTQTCSAGLHVCAKSYLAHYGTASGNRVVRCKVHPKDVVSVPIDYNNAKMRCSAYLVVDEVK